MDFLRINIGEIAISDKPGTFVCHGLSSCIGLFVYDYRARVAGAAHIQLPDIHHVGNNLEYAEPAVNELVNRIRSLGCLLLKAKLTGGASLFSQDSYEVGKRNALVVKRLLKKLGVTVTAEDLGGCFGRTARFHFPDNRLNIQTSLGRNYSI